MVLCSLDKFKTLVFHGTSIVLWHKFADLVVVCARQDLLACVYELQILEILLFAGEI